MNTWIVAGWSSLGDHRPAGICEAAVHNARAQPAWATVFCDRSAAAFGTVCMPWGDLS